MNDTIVKSGRAGAPRLLSILLALGLLAFTGSSLAQNVAAAPTSGTLTGTLDGQEIEWRTVILDTPDGEQNTASANRMTVGPMTMLDFTLQGSQGDEYVKGALALSFGVFGAAGLEDCPCEIADATATYWTTGSMFGSFYTGPVTLVIDSAVQTAEDRWSLTGSFEGTLAFTETIPDVDEDDTVSIAVTFTVGRADVVELELGN